MSGEYTVLTGDQWLNEHANNGNGEATPDDHLPMLDVSAWDGVEVPQRDWAVKDRIVRRAVTLLSGEGGVGKSILILQLACAHVLALDWFGTLPEPGPVIYLNAEDDERELHFRLEAIRAHLSTSFTALKDLHLVPLAGEDALLGVPDRSGIIRPTPLFERLLRTAAKIRPVLIALDTAADMFGGNENDRSQVRQFIGLLRRLAITGNAAVLLASHPSLNGINSDSGLSGSTGWHNSVRSRLYFKASETNGEASTDLRELVVRKNNYGPTGEVVRVMWRAGVFVPVARPSTLERAAAEQKGEDVFLRLLRRVASSGRNNVSDRKGTTFAPAVFAGEVEATEAGVSNTDLADAMKRLFASNRIKVVSEGPPSRIRTRIVEVGSDQDDVSTSYSTNSEDASTNSRKPLHQASTKPVHTPPYNPPGGGRVSEVVEATDPSTTGPAGAGRRFRLIGRTPAGTMCIACHSAEGDVMKIASAEPGSKPETLHEKCAAAWFEQDW